MAKTRAYQHFCPVARSLEVVGEKWSLLIVRDLLPGPQRYTDLLHSLGGITPKWLTQRLRMLEAAEIVERRNEPGRREVWYHLTPAGRELAPVVEALTIWGLDHTIRPPEPGEPVQPAHATAALVAFLNKRRARLDRPQTWVLQFGPDRAYLVRFDGATWSIERGDGPADLRIVAAPELWVTFLMAEPAERRRLAAEFQVAGSADRLADCLAIFGYREPALVR